MIKDSFKYSNKFKIMKRYFKPGRIFNCNNVWFTVSKISSHISSMGTFIMNFKIIILTGIVDYMFDNSIVNFFRHLFEIYFNYIEGNFNYNIQYRGKTPIWKIRLPLDPLLTYKIKNKLITRI